MVSEANSAVSRAEGALTAAGVYTTAGAAEPAAAFVSGREGSGAFFLEQATARTKSEQRATRLSLNAIDQTPQSLLKRHTVISLTLIVSPETCAVKPPSQGIQWLKFVNRAKVTL